MKIYSAVKQLAGSSISYSVKQNLVSVGNVHQHIRNMRGNCKIRLTLTRNVEKEAVLQQVRSRDFRKLLNQEDVEWRWDMERTEVCWEKWDAKQERVRYIQKQGGHASKKKGCKAARAQYTQKKQGHFWYVLFRVPQSILAFFQYDIFTLPPILACIDIYSIQ